MRWVVAAALCLPLASCVEAPPPPPREVAWRLLGSWRGRGNQQLETFPIQGGTLRLQWEASRVSAGATGHLRVRVQSGDSGRVIAEPIDVRGPGRDLLTVVVEHHRVYLTVESADLDWSIRVEELDTKTRK